MRHRYSWGVVKLVSPTDYSRDVTYNEIPFDLTTFEVSADPDYSYVMINPQTGAIFMNATFKLAGYLFEYSFTENPILFGSAIGRNLKKINTT